MVNVTLFINSLFSKFKFFSFLNFFLFLVFFFHFFFFRLIRVEISKKNFEKVRFLFSKAIQSRSLLSVNKKLWKSFFQFEMEFGDIQKKEQVVFLAKEKGIHFKIRN